MGMYYLYIGKKKGKMIDSFFENGFLMGSSKKIYHIEESRIHSIRVFQKSISSSLATSFVLKKYHKLIALLTNLLLDDDDSGDSLREVLNQIEKFRLEIKIKYRNFLKQKELEMMAKQLQVLKTEAKKRLLEIEDSYQSYREGKRSR